MLRAGRRGRTNSWLAPLLARRRCRRTRGTGSTTSCAASVRSRTAASASTRAAASRDCGVGQPCAGAMAALRARSTGCSADEATRGVRAVAAARARGPRDGRGAPVRGPAALLRDRRAHVVVARRPTITARRSPLTRGSARRRRRRPATRAWSTGEQQRGRGAPRHDARRAGRGEPRLRGAARLHLHRVRDRPQRRRDARRPARAPGAHSRRASCAPRPRSRRRSRGCASHKLDRRARMITTHVLDTAVGRPGDGDRDRARARRARRVAPRRRRRHRRRRPPAHADPAGARSRRAPTGSGSRPARTSRRTATPGSSRVVEIQFTVVDGAQHYHVPLLLSPYGYSTYRGS